MNVIKQIRQFNAGREPERLALKYRNMRSDPFVFLRATCHLFYAQLPLEPVLRRVPVAWACGDLHLENVGSYKGDNRQVYFDLNDFDEALLAPLTWDPVRCLTSILVGRHGMRLGARADAVAQELCEVFLNAYAQALADGKARWVERETAPPPVSDLLQAVRSRQRPEFLDTRTLLQGRRRRMRIDGRKALAATPGQRERVMAFFRDFAARQPVPRFFDVLDVARRIAGNGSLGVDRYIVLVRGKGSPDGNYLLDLKQAVPSSLLPRVPITQPRWADEAQRVVTIQRRMQAIAMAFLHPVQMGGGPYVLRGLQPSEDRVALAYTRHPVALLRNVATVMGQCLAWAQLRSSGRGGSAMADELIDFGSRQKWRAKLMEIARHCASQAELDWKVFAAAYDDGEFGPPLEQDKG
ncbi:DUF2252 domain-containing protein [Xylophilus sp. ASV27]|uniref:DUF2252 domain-containing protein n=1 Tax=Xylophilus sp. ASV27 TaxID=2795129 RepID=UPI0018EDF11F|nr:DUF2252 family protein [Xylophilus sp. ASV27]